jgi:hypothetical protein
MRAGIFLFLVLNPEIIFAPHSVTYSKQLLVPFVDCFTTPSVPKLRSV